MKNTLSPVAFGISMRQCLNNIFVFSQQDDQNMEVQIFQVANETISDLLVKDLKQIASANLAKKAPVKSTDEAIQIFEEALDNRAIAAAKIGGKRARAHQVITIKVPGAGKGEEPGCLQLVDLSGSERVGRSDATGDKFCLHACGLVDIECIFIT